MNRDMREKIHTCKFTHASIVSFLSRRNYYILTISNDVSRLYCRPLKTDRTKLKAIRRSVEHGVRIKRQLVISQVVVSLSQASNRIDDSSLLLLLLLLSRGGRKTQPSSWIFHGVTIRQVFKVDFSSHSRHFDRRHLQCTNRFNTGQVSRFDLRFLSWYTSRREWIMKKRIGGYCDALFPPFAGENSLVRPFCSTNHARSICG